MIKKFVGIKEELERRDKLGDKGLESREFDINKWWNVYIFCRGFDDDDEFEMMNDKFVNFFVEVY